MVADKHKGVQYNVRLDAGLLRSRPQGTFHYYAAEYTALRALTEYLWEDCCKRGSSCC